MDQVLATILQRLHARSPNGRWVDGSEIACLEAELGRPLPRLLKSVWRIYGAGALGPVRLASPREVSMGLAMSDRFLDEGLLPIGTGAGGETWTVELSRSDDPDLVLALDFPRKLRAVVGPISRAVEVTALAALRDAAPVHAAERRELANRITVLDPDGRYRNPGAWAEAPVALCTARTA